MPNIPDIDGGTEVLTESETKLEKPKLFKVLLHNDDFTTMEFVVWILQYVFLKADAEAISIMLSVHNDGVGVADPVDDRVGVEAVRGGRHGCPSGSAAMSGRTVVVQAVGDPAPSVGHSSSRPASAAAPYESLMRTTWRPGRSRTEAAMDAR